MLKLLAPRSPAPVALSVVLAVGVAMASLARAPAHDAPEVGPIGPSDEDEPTEVEAPLTTAERLRITLLGGNPIFALDWLAPELELTGGRPMPIGSRLPPP